MDNTILTTYNIYFYSLFLVVSNKFYNNKIISLRKNISI